jgi:hypothetical protein
MPQRHAEVCGVLCAPIDLIDPISLPDSSALAALLNCIFLTVDRPKVAGLSAPAKLLVTPLIISLLPSLGTVIDVLTMTLSGAVPSISTCTSNWDCYAW